MADERLETLDTVCDLRVVLNLARTDKPFRDSDVLVDDRLIEGKHRPLVPLQLCVCTLVNSHKSSLVDCRLVI